jgi:glycerol kinase
VGYWSSLDEVATQWQTDAEFAPIMPAEQREVLYTGWQRAVERSRGWAV